MRVKLLRATEDPVQLIADIAGECYDKPPKDALERVKMLYRNGHESVFEHVYFTFRIEGISRIETHQQIRHRHCAYTQRSQRYCNEENQAYVMPDSIHEKCEGLFNSVVQVAQESYKIAISNGVPKEDARYMLPHGIETSIVVSCNLRELIHLANERMCSHAQWEIRECVKKMCDLVPKELHFMLTPRCGRPTYRCLTPCGKGVKADA